jgi:hypothetical protein
MGRQNMPETNANFANGQPAESRPSNAKNARMSNRFTGLSGTFATAARMQLTSLPLAE